jgi:hypothetical protein
MTRSNSPAEPRYPDVPVGPRLEAVLALAYRARRAVLLEGPTGIGKSEIVQEVARSLGVATTVLDLSLLEPPDLVGLPVISDGRTEYAVPRALPRDGAGILMLEELNRAERYIQQPALQLLTARRVHEYVLPAGWVCFAAVNPTAGDYQVTPLDRALRARFLNVPVRADRASWLAWAVRRDVHPAVVAIVQGHDRVFDDVPPRSWTYASDVLRALTPAESADETLLRDALGGYLPPSWCELLLASRASWSSADLGLDVRDVLAAYAPDHPAAATVRTYRDRGQTDRLDELTHRVLGVVRGPELGVLAAQKQFSLAAFEALLGDLPGDQRDKLQEAITANPVAAALVDVRPEDLVQNFAGSVAERKLADWQKNPLQKHRVGVAITALRAHLEQHGRRPEVRRDNIVRINLGLVLARLDERWAMPLVDTLLKLGITPVRPG